MTKQEAETSAEKSRPASPRTKRRRSRTASSETPSVGGSTIAAAASTTDEKPAEYWQCIVLDRLVVTGVYLKPASDAKPLMYTTLYRGQGIATVADLPQGWDIRVDHLGAYVRRLDSPIQWIPLNRCVTGDVRN